MPEQKFNLDALKSSQLSLETLFKEVAPHLALSDTSDAEFRGTWEDVTLTFELLFGVESLKQTAMKKEEVDVKPVLPKAKPGKRTPQRMRLVPYVDVPRVERKNGRARVIKNEEDEKPTKPKKTGKKVKREVETVKKEESSESDSDLGDYGDAIDSENSGDDEDEDYVGNDYVENEKPRSRRQGAPTASPRPQRRTSSPLDARHASPPVPRVKAEPLDDDDELSATPANPRYHLPGHQQFMVAKCSKFDGQMRLYPMSAGNLGVDPRLPGQPFIGLMGNFKFWQKVKAEGRSIPCSARTKRGKKMVWTYHGNYSVHDVLRIETGREYDAAPPKWRRAALDAFRYYATVAKKSKETDFVGWGFPPNFGDLQGDELDAAILKNLRDPQTSRGIAFVVFEYRGIDEAEVALRVQRHHDAPELDAARDAKRAAKKAAELAAQQIEGQPQGKRKTGSKAQKKGKAAKRRKVASGSDD
ncbi:hypothetical protein MNV49_004961 [Pseudohyphozyma bogoriensis]|nr:hypothetical protein MNV49_004961 [Pseudohyphozyma bogoriensis]